MRRAAVIVLVFALAGAAEAGAQRRRTPARKPAPRPAPMKIEAAKVTCPESLGVGVRTKANYCFVLAGRDPAEGVLVAIPPHTGPATLLFDLHNRHTYSEEAVKAGRGFAKYSAVIGVLSMKGELLGRAAVQSEFRAARDLFERIGGGAGPTGFKAVAPIGREQIVMAIPANVDQVSLLGEILDATTVAGRETATPGRTVAVVSNIRLEYRPRR
jgi:hypothetical protein